MKFHIVRFCFVFQCTTQPSCLLRDGWIDSRSVFGYGNATRGIEFRQGGSIQFKLGGNPTLEDFLRTGGDLINVGKMDSWQEVLGESSFKLGLYPEEGASNQATVWGYGEFRSLSGSGAGKVDGDVFIGHLGFDTLTGDGMVAGLATSHSKAEFEYGLADDQALSYTTRTTGLQPYLGLQTSDGSRLQVIAGYGIGEIGLSQQRYETEMLDSSYVNFGASGNRVLY